MKPIKVHPDRFTESHGVVITYEFQSAYEAKSWAARIAPNNNCSWMRVRTDEGWTCYFRVTKTFTYALPQHYVLIYGYEPKDAGWYAHERNGIPRREML